MSNDTDTVRVYFPATIPKDQVDGLVSLLTGRDDDVLLDMERAVNRRIEHAEAYSPEWTAFFDKVEFDAPIVAPEWGGRADWILLEDVVPEVTAR